MEVPSLTCPYPVVVIFLEPQEGALFLLDQVAMSLEFPELVIALENDPVEHVLNSLCFNRGLDPVGCLLLEEFEGVILLGGIDQFLQCVHPGAELLHSPVIRNWLVVSFLHFLVL